MLLLFCCKSGTEFFFRQINIFSNIVEVFLCISTSPHLPFPPVSVISVYIAKMITWMRNMRPCHPGVELKLFLLSLRQAYFLIDSFVQLKMNNQALETGFAPVSPGEVFKVFGSDKSIKHNQYNNMFTFFTSGIWSWQHWWLCKIKTRWHINTILWMYYTNI